MSYLDDYLQQVKEKGHIELANSIKKTAEDVYNNFLSSFSFLNHEIGLIYGNIQSGKTSQTFGIITKATDYGFPIFFILTSNNNLLQKQMLSRVQKDLPDYCICDEGESEKFIQNMLVKPTIIVIKKNSRILKFWANIFANTQFMKGNPLFIIDDEADESSLNTLINTGGYSSINRYLNLIKNESSSSIYLQVTGTPQALLLQSSISGWHPNFIYYFSPGDGYLGGDFFFPNEGNPQNIIFLDDLNNVVRTVLIRHLIVSSQLFLTGSRVSNCLIHPSVLQIEHEKYANEFLKELYWLYDNFNDFKKLAEIEYANLKPKNTIKQDFSDIINQIKQMFDMKMINVIILNGKNPVNFEQYHEGCNFIIGGNSLSRGVTFPSLNTIYYTRTSNNPQADTMWQHSRMFGYDRDPGLMRVFIDRNLYKLFLDINYTNNSMISQLKKGQDSIKVFYPESISPTRRNVIDNNLMHIISGGTNYFASNPDNSSIDYISKLLKYFNDSTSHFQVTLNLIKEILMNIIPSDDFKLDEYLSILDSIMAENPIQQGILIVRRNRNVTQGTGALLSSNDWELVNSFENDVVLVMYQINANNGWKKDNLWVPNIKFPNGIIFYGISE